MNGLYGNKCPHCGGMHFRSAAEMGVTFSPEVLTTVLQSIYDGLDVKNEIQADAWAEFLRLYNLAALEGIMQADRIPPRMDTFLEQLKTNNEVFSSHPTWVRGLKQTIYKLNAADVTSHPTWVRGLKLQQSLQRNLFQVSHPTWVRGLKLSEVLQI